MGVRHLWSLLSVAGLKSSPAGLRGLRLAIDASIWLMQFSAVGENFSGQLNYEILLFFKRLVKLILLGVRPVIVFDGATPEIKRRTLMERFKQKYRSERNYKKMAQKIILRTVGIKKIKIPRGLGFGESQQSQDSADSEYSQALDNLKPEDEAEILKMLDEYENALEQREIEENQMAHQIMIRENERLILQSGHTLESFERLPLEEQEELIDYWRQLDKKHKGRQVFASYEDASLKLLGDFLKETEDQKKVKEFKSKLAEKENQKAASTVNAPLGSSLVSSTRLEWNRNRVMFFFRQQEANQQSEDNTGPFGLAKKKYITKKQKERKLEDMCKQYDKRFNVGIEGDEEGEEQPNIPLAPNPEGIDLVRDIKKRDTQSQNQKKDQTAQKKGYVKSSKGDLDDMFNRSRSSSADSLFKINKDSQSPKNVKKAAGGWSSSSEDEADRASNKAKNDEFNNYLKGELAKITAQGSERPSQSMTQELDDAPKPIIEEGRKLPKKIPKNYDPNKPKKGRGYQGRAARNDGPSGTEEEFLETGLTVEQLREEKRQGQDWQTMRDRLHNVFEEDNGVMPRASGESRLSQNDDDKILLNAWLDQDEKANPLLALDRRSQSQGALSQAEDNENSSSNMNADNIFNFFSGGYARENPDAKNKGIEITAAPGNRLAGLRQAFVDERAPRARSAATDPLHLLKTLLGIMGIPYVMAQTESEAQCAQLELENKVDGTITEDCDAFLFGSKMVVKGIFGTKPNIELYKMEEIITGLGLNREQLIMLALFLGSDYCTGIRGVGVVNAVEIVDAFSTVDSLERFKEWAEKPDLWTDPEIYAVSKEEHPKEYEYFVKHRNYKKEWELPPNFPDPRVVHAFKEPLVVKNANIEFGSIDLPALVDFARANFNLDEDHLELLKKPLVKELEKRNNGDIRNFFRPVPNRVEINSNRLKTSLQNLRRGKLDADIETDIIERSRAGNKKSSQSNRKSNSSKKPPTLDEAAEMLGDGQDIFLDSESKKSSSNKMDDSEELPARRKNKFMDSDDEKEDINVTGRKDANFGKKTTKQR